MSLTSTPKIAIIGAGPGGLLVANILQRNSVPYSIFEANSSPRIQGGSLDLHAQFGQAAMKAAGLWDAFLKHARYESDRMKVVNSKGEVLADENAMDQDLANELHAKDSRPEIDRGALLAVLVEGLPADAISFSHKLKAVVPVDNTYTLEFADGTPEAGFGLVVGADGAWSKVRNLLTDEKPTYSGISGLSFRIEQPATRNPWLHEFIGAGSLFSFSANRSVQAQRQGDGSVWTYAMIRTPENFISELAASRYGIDWDNVREAKDKFIDAFYSDYAPNMVRVLRESRDASDPPRALYHFPVGFKWQHNEENKAVTLLGDAAHVMTPFAGVGVNAAFADGMALAERIVKFVNGDSEAKSFAEVVADYEEDMHPRNTAFAKRTMNGLTGHFSEGGSEHYANRIRTAYDEATAKKAQASA